VATDTSPVRSLPNVHFLGRKEHQLLPSYSKGFDVAILPFVINELTLAANPLKVREYLAAGLPVVATPIPEVERFMGQLRIGKSYAHFLSQVEAVIAEGQIGPQLSISSAMDNESWDHKVEEISQIITGLESPMASKKALAS
jgi:glycosyltransferase involved in cell wall biosynthesis